MRDLLDIARDGASLIASTGAKVHPAVWTVSSDGEELGVFSLSNTNRSKEEHLAAMLLVARALGSQRLILIADTFVRKYNPDELVDESSLPSPSDDPLSVEAIVVYEAKPPADVKLYVREYHRNDDGSVRLDDWEGPIKAVDGWLNDVILEAVNDDDPVSKESALWLANEFGFGIMVMPKDDGNV